MDSLYLVKEVLSNFRQSSLCRRVFPFLNRVLLKKIMKEEKKGKQSDVIESRPLSEERFS